MFSKLKVFCWKYNCFVFSSDDNNGFFVYGLEFDLLQLCMKNIIRDFNVSYLSNYMSFDDIRGYYYYLEIN